MNKQYFTQLDGLRFLAAFAVMVQHWVTNQLFPAPFGFFGVTLFFVLSGFLITRILFIEKQRVITGLVSPRGFFTNFYFRRCLRIFPLYFLVVALLLIFDCGPSRESVFWLVTHTINIKFAIQSGYDGWINHFWSLAIEEQFYLFFPLVIFCAPQKYFVRVLIFLVVFGVLCRMGLFIGGASYRSIGFVTFSCLDSFGLGGLLAYLYMYKGDMLKKIIESRTPLVILVVCFVVAIGARGYLGQDASYQIVWFRLIVSLFSMWLIGRAVYGFTGIVKVFLECSWISYLGKISYGLYVYHNFAHYIFASLIGEKESLEIYMAPVYFVFTVAVSALSWHFFENPINQIKNSKK